MVKKTLERTKPHVNVGTIGHDGYGKTTLTSAITAVLKVRGLAKMKSYDDIAKASEAQDRRGRTEFMLNPVAQVEYESQKRHYTHIDCPGYEFTAKIAGPIQMDGAILVVSLADGPVSQTYLHVLLARQANIPQLVVFLNKKKAPGLKDFLRY